MRDAASLVLLFEGIQENADVGSSLTAAAQVALDMSLHSSSMRMVGFV